MRALFVCALALSLHFPLPAMAQVDEDPWAQDDLSEPPLALPADPDAGESPGAPTLPAAETRDLGLEQPAPPTLDELFTDLKREPSSERAETIAAQIQAEWLRSGSETVDLLLVWAAQAAQGGNSGAALDLYEQAMLLAPGHAGAWNGRATLNFQLERYGRSLADIEQTLRREPRHFGALMGLGAILEETDRKEAALDAYRRVLDVYPSLRAAQDAFVRLTAETRGQSL